MASRMTVRWLPYSRVRNQQRLHPLRQSEIPTEHTLSLPLPTLRWGNPAFACFAGPAVRRAGRPLEQGPPDRWWAVDAATGRVLAYALCRIVPYADATGWRSTELPAPDASMQDLRQILVGIEELMDAVTPAFFAGEGIDPEVKQAMDAALRVYINPSLEPFYRGLVPDFFSWLRE